MEQRERPQQSAQAGADGQRRDLLSDIREALVELRNRLAHQLDDATVAELRREVEGLLNRIQQDLSRPEESGARFRFERALALQPAFERVIRTWTDFRAAAGLEAAREIRDESDTFSGWEERWGPLFDVAWTRRGMLESTPRAAWAARGRGAEALAGGRSRIDRTDPVLALDLRYAAGLPLAHIAELLNLSPAAIQIRLADFEDGILVAAAGDVVKRQIPEGWRLVPAGKDRAGSELTLIRQQGTARAEISLPIVPVWSDREISVGRPRSASRMVVIRPARRQSTIWVLVFSDGPRVTFLPENSLREKIGSDEVTLPALIGAAHEFGVEVLADALRQTPSADGKGSA